MLNTTNSVLALLQEEDEQIKSIAIDKLSLIVDENWSEISDYIIPLQTYYQSKTIQNKEKDIALILSKIYYNLEDYDSAITWALKSEDKFNIKEPSLYVTTLLKKILDKYIKIRKENFYQKDKEHIINIEERIQKIVEDVFNNCLNEKNIGQAIGFSLESFDLDRLAKAIESTNNIKDNLTFVNEIIQDFVVNTEYKSAILNKMLELYVKHASKEYMDITNCQFLLNNTEALSSTLVKILNVTPDTSNTQNTPNTLNTPDEQDDSMAYQIAFDLYDNQNPAYLRSIVENIKKISSDPNKKIPEEAQKKIDILIKILTGEIPRSLISLILQNKLNLSEKFLPQVKKANDKEGSIIHLGIVICNSLLNSHTTNIKFLKDNVDWISKATNWASFSTISSIGAINMGYTQKGMDIMRPYLPGGQHYSLYGQGGAYYGLGLIYANTNDEKIMAFLRENLDKPINNKEAVQHGIFLAIGLVAMGTHNQELYERLRDGIYTDDAIIGEAAGYAVGLVMAGSKDEGAIDDLVKYAHDTQHEKIIRAIAIALSLIVFGAEENADALIDTLCLEKDPIMRYGAMYCIGMAYAGTGNTKMLKKLIRFSVSDVSNDVRRAAMINIGFLQIREPDILFEKLNVVKLLSESYNNNVRYGAAMAIGICCAGTAKAGPFKVIEPLYLDSNYLVRQAAYIATGLIFSQTTQKQEPALKNFSENLAKIIPDKDEHLLIKFGVLIASGLMELGGRNCKISMVSPSGSIKMSAVIGMNLFTQFYYWFPMLHFIHLAVSPAMLMGIDNSMKLIKGYKYLNKAKPSLYGYPQEEMIPEKAKAVKTETAVLSTHNRVKAKGRKTGTATIGEIKAQSSSNVNLKPAPSGPVGQMEVDDKGEKKEEEKKEEKKEGEEEEKKPEEPDQCELENPIRIIPRQVEVVEEIKEQDYKAIIKGRVGGFVLLKKINDKAVTEYEEFMKVEVKENNEPQGNQAGNQNNNYQPVPQNDAEIPEDIDMANL